MRTALFSPGCFVGLLAALLMLAALMLWRCCRRRQARTHLLPAWLLGLFRVVLESERTLFAAVVHDLRNPLGAASIHLRLLREQLHKPPGAEQPDAPRTGAPLLSLASCERALARAEHIAAALFDYVQCQRGQLLLLVQPDVDLALLIEEILDEQAPLLGGRPIRVELAPDLPALLADPLRLSQTLINLLSNACKYTPRDTPVGVRARRLDSALALRLPGRLPTQSGPWVLLTVWDLGAGIPPAERERLFSPFYRLPRDRKRGGGLGLGLYISRYLCEAHGGRLWLDDAPGASFTMLWPATPLDYSPSQAMEQRLLSTSAGQPHTESIRVPIAAVARS